MTLANIARSTSFNTTGVSLGPFAIPFQFFEIEVYLDGALVSPALYTVAWDSEEPGLAGSITFIENEEPTGFLEIIGVTNRVQQADYIAGGAFPAASHEKALDRLTMIAQELKATLDNAVMGAIGTGTAADIREALDVYSVSEVDSEITAALATLSSVYQPLSANLTAWSAVNPSSYSTTAQIAAAYQPLDTDLTAWAGVNPSSYYTSAQVDSAIASFLDQTEADARYLKLNHSVSAAPTIDGDHSFWFSTYEALTHARIVYTDTENQSFAGGGFRTGLTILYYDDDNTDYEALSRQKVSYGLRVFVTPPTAAENLTDAKYKDLVAGEFVSIGRVEWADRGCSGITALAIQYGEGISSNEFHALQPSDAVTQSLSMAAVQAVISSKKAASDGSHLARGVLVTNLGKSVTAALDVHSAGTDGDNGQFEYLLRGNLATVNVGAILMPASASGDVGTRTVYDPGDYSAYDRSGNLFSWVIGDVGRLGLSIGALYPVVNDGLTLGGASNGFADLFGATGFTFNLANGNWVATHTSGILTVGTGDLRVTTAGTDAASVVTVGGAQTLTSKSLTSPTLTGTITLGDAAFNVTLSAGLATITFDTSDQLYYERSTNSFNFVIGGSGELFLNANTLSPIANDGLGLGTPTTSYADLFLAAGAVINFNNSNGTLTHSAGLLTTDGLALVWNEAGADLDVRMEGDTDTALFFLDASTDRVGIGTSSPGVKFHVNGAGNYANGLRVGFTGAPTDDAVYVGDGSFGLNFNSGTSPILEFAANDYIAYGRVADLYQFVIGGTARMELQSTGLVVHSPSTTTPATLGTNGQWTLTPTSNTNFRISHRGTDGVTRVGNITLA